MPASNMVRNAVSLHCKRKLARLRTLTVHKDCGNNFQGGSATTAASDCNMPCTGNSTEICGAGNRLNVFWNGAQAPPPPTTNPGVNGWTYVGCYTDSNTRTLPNVMTVPGGTTNMTIALCTSACKASGYTYAGAEYAGECCKYSFLHS